MVISEFRYLIKKHKTFLFWMCGFQILFSMIIMFIIGIYYNNNYEQHSIYSSMKSISINIGNEYRKSQFVDSEKMINEYFSVFGKYENIISSATVLSEGMCEGKKVPIFSKFKTENGKFYPTDMYYAKLTEGRNFNIEDFNNGEKVCIIPMSLAKGHHSSIVISNEEYEVIAYQTRKATSENGVYWEDTCYVPFKSIGRKMFSYEMIIEFNRALLKNEYNDIKMRVELLWGDKVKLSNFVEEDINDTEVRKTINFTVIIVALLVSATLCALYYYLLICKRKLSAVNVLCGLSVRKVILRQILEVALITATNTALGCVLYLNFIKKPFEKQFIWFSLIYSEIKCVNIMVIYAAIIILINAVFIFWIMNKKPIDILRDAKRV